MKEILIGFLLFSFVQCTSHRKEEIQIMKEAAAVHNKMMIQAEVLEEKLNLMMNDSSYLSLTDSITVWKNALTSWESEMVEVPGNEEHAHKEGTHHHHDHQQLNATGAEMMVIQLELQRHLQSLAKRMEYADSIKK